jgi:hypothetical protein
MEWAGGPVSTCSGRAVAIRRGASGLPFPRTTIKQVRQQHNRDNKAKLTRIVASMRRGFTRRSLNSPSWRRSTKFSASSAHRGLSARTAKPTRSANDRRTI